jgi:hypothetical protein
MNSAPKGEGGYWKDFYIDERCSIARGSGSKLVDAGAYSEHEKLVCKVGYWTRSVLYHYIMNIKGQKADIIKIGHLGSIILLCFY